MVVVALVSLAIVGAAAMYPLVSPIRDAIPPGSPLARAAGALTGLAWLATLLVAMARQPRGRLWKLILAYIVIGRLAALEFVPDSLVWSVAVLLEDLWVAVFVHLVLAYPSGYLRDRFDRGVVALGYTLIAVLPVSRLLFGGEARFACTPECIRNVFGIWRDLGLLLSLERGVTIIAVGVLGPLVLVSLWRHWRDAGSAGRRTLLPLVVAVPVLVVVVALERLSRVLDVQPGIDFFDGPSGTAISLLAPLIFPVGLLAGIIRARWSRGRVARLVVELGRGVPVGGLRDVLARALGDPTLQLAFAAPSGSGSSTPAVDPRRAARSTTPAGWSPGSSATMSSSASSSTTRRSRPRTRASSKRSGTRPGWPSRTSGSQPRSGPSSRRSGRRGCGSSRRPTRSAAGSSATSTTAPSSGSSPSRCGSRSPSSDAR